MTYQPRTEGGKASSEALSAPFEWLADKADYAGDKSAEYTGSPAYGAITKAMIETAPALIGKPGNYYSGKNVSNRMIRDVVESEGRQNIVRDALIKADPELTAAQAVVPARSPQTASMFKLAEKDAPSAYEGIHNYQRENKVVDALKKVADTPEVNTFKKRIRKGVADKYYAAGREGFVPEGKVAEIVTNIDTIIRENSGNSKMITPLESIKKGLIDREGNIITDAKQVMSSVDALREALKLKEIGGNEIPLVKLKKALTELSPKTVEGNKNYAQMSRSINQNDIVNRLVDQVAPRMGTTKERASVYKTAIANEKNTIRAATDKKLNAKELEQVMSPKQMKAMDAVGEFLDINVDAATQSTKGMKKMADITGNTSGLPRAPHILNTAFVIFNSIVKRIEGKTSSGALDRITELGKPQNRAELNALMKKLTTEERTKLINAYTAANAAILSTGDIDSSDSPKHIDHWDKDGVPQYAGEQ